MAAEYESLKARAKAMDAKYNEAIEYVKATENNEFLDLCARHLYAVSHKATGVKPAAVARVQRSETVLLGRKLRHEPVAPPRCHQVS